MWNNLITYFVLIILVLLIVAKGQAFERNSENEAAIERLPFCGDEDHRTINRRLLYVSTLDGKITALDISKNGQVHWSVKTSPGNLLSSSIHRLELTNNGQLVRMIPSLSGSLYKFDGDTIDPIPITVDNLLSSSFKFSEDLVISGGKETRSYGVSLRTGQTLYECSLHGCINMTDAETHYDIHHDTLVDDVVVIRRRTQTVRAIEPRTGVERWNFSVGHHELEVLNSPDCHEKSFNNVDLGLLDVEFRVVVPEGIICAVSKRSPNVIMWKHQFDHPIVNVWQTDRHDNLKALDLFQSTEWIWNGEREEIFINDKVISPSIYLGMFQKQLYIQESDTLRQLVHEHANRFNHHLISNEVHFPRIPWKPYAAGTSSLALIADDNFQQTESEENEGADVENQIESTSVTALSVLYASEYVNGNGFYLFSQEDLNKTESALCDGANTTSANQSEINHLNEIDDPEDSPVNEVFTSWWANWKEIIVISFVTAFILNFLLAPKIQQKTHIVVEKYVEIPVPIAEEATEDSELKRKNSQRSFSESCDSGMITSENFRSRFVDDFDLIQCLGKGGFGVVFEAKNKIDDVNYAIKRITLPNKRESRDRVMREVRTLANCEHQNIVRYFHAWVENPPPGWQESEDSKWLNSGSQYSAIDIETPDGSVLPKFPTKPTIDKSISCQNGIIKSWTNHFDDSGFSNKNCQKFNGNVDDEDEDDDSFIQFCDSNDPKYQENYVNETTIHSSKQHSLKRLSEDNDSHEIEFERYSSKGITNATSPDNIWSSTDCTQSTHPKKRRHSRPVSLDLSSKGNVVVPNATAKSQTKVYLYIQMQLCRKHSLREWLQQHKADNRRSEVDNIFKQIVEAVDYVHQKGLIHRDLKPSNIFFSLDGQVKIGDFGLVTDMKDVPNLVMACGDKTGLPSCHRHTQQVGTYLYMSPEQLRGKPYNFKVDIFSIGLIFFELLVDFGTEMERTTTLKCLREGVFPNDFQRYFSKEYNLLQLMLSEDPHKRPDTSTIKERLNDMTIVPQ